MSLALVQLNRSITDDEGDSTALLAVNIIMTDDAKELSCVPQISIDSSRQAA